MISLRLWLISLLLTLPLYTYSLNQQPNRPADDVFQKRDWEDAQADLAKRQVTDPNEAASISSVIQSVSNLIKSITENPDLFSASISEIEASISSVILSISSQIYDATTPQATPASTTTTPAPTTPGFSSSTTTSSPSTTPPVGSSTTSPPASTGTPGQVITDGTRTGTVGDDGTTRFCSASSYLCPASVNYGCCRDGYMCGLTACTPSAGVNPSSAGAGVVTFTPSGGSSATTEAAYSFNPTEKGGSVTTSSGSSSGGGGGLSGGAIGGIVGGVVGGVALIAAGVVWFCLSKGKSKPKDGADGTKPGPTEQYTGGPIPPQPQMAQYAQTPNPDPRYSSPPPQGEGYYQPYPQQQYPNQQGAQPPYGQNVSELGGAALPYGQKNVEQPQGISEAPANPATHQAPAPQENQPAAGYDGSKGPSGPVYELGS
ncbi:hypothetical protein TWF694_010734 [Orbilia ellipsospora]|uniref:Uncharacterized protein n=1 Tax=Orbilia ellipsospora TaxID=2528407 RepID=A0AAV9X9V1_9PEZI